MRLNQSPAQIYYISEVLGAGAFVAPVENFKAVPYRFLVYVEQELQADERDFISKMLAAISETHYLNQVGVIDLDAIAKDNINFAICFAKTPSLSRPIKWIELPALNVLLGKDVTTTQMNTAKKTAWAQLKFLKQEMDAQCV